VYKFLVAFHTGRIHSDSGEHNALIGVCPVWENRRLRGFLRGNGLAYSYAASVCCDPYIVIRLVCPDTEMCVLIDIKT